MMQFIVKMPETEKFSGLTDEARKAIQGAKGQFPNGWLSGTKAVDGYCLKLLMCDITQDEFNDLIANGSQSIDEEGNVTFTPLGLDWEVIACECESIDHSLILPYMAGIPVYDEENQEVISYDTITNITGKLQTYAGRKWQY
jgi:hypothetical protein